ncbi:MAG: hypothetical protein ABGY75_22345 [Gemmataceae bacterium]
MSEESKSWQQQLAAFAKGVVTEAVMPAAEKLIPQGAAELSQALYTGSAYMPYGPTEKPVPMEMDHGVHGPQAGPGLPQQTTQVAQSETHTSYEAMLSTYAAKAQEQQHNRENQR